MEITTASKQARTIQNERIEGIGIAKARKLAATRQQFITWAENARNRGNDAAAFDFDCQAFDIESDLRRYGFERLI